MFDKASLLRLRDEFATRAAFALQEQLQPLHLTVEDLRERIIQCAVGKEIVESRRDPDRDQIVELIAHRAFGHLPTFGAGVDDLLVEERQRRRVMNLVCEAATDVHEQLEPLAEAVINGTVAASITAPFVRQVERTVARRRRIYLWHFVVVLAIAGVAAVTNIMGLISVVTAAAATAGAAVATWWSARTLDWHDHA